MYIQNRPVFKFYLTDELDIYEIFIYIMYIRTLDPGGSVNASNSMRVHVLLR